jgi:hypothetical protein
MSEAEQLVGTAKALGITEEDLIERVVDRLSNAFLDHDEYAPVETRFGAQVEEMIKERIDSAVEKLADEHIGAQVEEMVAAVTLRETNKWGEAKGEPVTFREYLVHRTETWLTEQVNYQGKSRSEDSYNWKGSNTRVAFMIHQHLDHHISAAIKKALKNLNEQVAGGLEQTVKLQIEKVLAKLEVDVKV